MKLFYGRNIWGEILVKTKKTKAGQSVYEEREEVQCIKDQVAGFCFIMLENLKNKIRID